LGETLKIEDRHNKHCVMQKLITAGHQQMFLKVYAARGATALPCHVTQWFAKKDTSQEPAVTRVLLKDQLKQLQKQEWRMKGMPCDNALLEAEVEQQLQRVWG
jgi:hypothetical protein